MDSLITKLVLAFMQITKKSTINKADKISNGIIGNLVTVGADGNPVDSGKTLSDCVSCQTEDGALCIITETRGG